MKPSLICSGIFSLVFLFSSSILAQTFVVTPYLQDATPNSIRIMWETSSGEESTVNYGPDENLGNTISGISFASDGTAMLHDVQLTSLERFTTYHYQVVTGNAISDSYQFKTPPFASDEESFRFVAMSDMQQSSADPEVFGEVIHDGILDYLQEEFGGAVSDNLALAIIPGDLVDYGYAYGQWNEDFFAPSADLFNQIPVYPVLGNHEVNTNYYFQYFHLPENGSEGYEEHWWWKDYGNVRFIGLDSNGPYNGQGQLDWLEGVLANTCDADSIDFVFAELHHPHKSELWTPGETVFSGDVVELMENFSEACGKPSIHFFGHTHGYSRGQSRDYKHTWINVATAGGAIDYWGDWPQLDYDEFTVSDDDWGFVLVEVEAGDDPEFSVKRLSRGDNYTDLDNEEIDSFTVTKVDYEITTPTPLYPVNMEIAPECVILHASEFELDDIHGATHWQVSNVDGDFDAPLANVWEQHENIYFNEDTQAGESITNEHISGLTANSQYWWRVRYRDRQLNWSDWTDATAFTTGESTLSENLLTNPGSENLLEDWTIDDGVCESMLAGDCAGTNPYTGNRYFAVGGLCTESAVGIMHQDIDVTAYVDSIELGNFDVSYGAMMSDWSGSDIPEMRLLFMTLGGTVLETTYYLSGPYTSWTLVEDQTEIPVLTRVIRCELKGTRNEGTDNDCYFDDIFIKVGSESECDTSVIIIREPSLATTSISAYPNPALDSTTIDIPIGWAADLKICITDSEGRKVATDVDVYYRKVIISRGNLNSGAYYVTFFNNQGHRATTQIIFE